MKQPFLILVLMVILSACQDSGNSSGISNKVVNNPATASEKSSPDKMPVIEFESTSHDFGRVFSGEKVSHAFKFTNTGKSDLIISSVVPGCGCTAPSWPKKPVKPGESEYISLVFSSSGFNGSFNKSAKVYTNTIPNVTELIISGTVIKE